MSPTPQLSPEEVALLIKDRRNEIALLQLFLPPLDEGGVQEVREYRIFWVIRPDHSIRPV
jgi:hypothetical protein